MLTIFSKLLKYRTNNLLAWRLLLYILLCSVFFTFLATIFQLYTDYRNDRELIEARIQQIQKSYVPGLSDSVWYFDNELMETQLNGILQLLDIQYLEIQREKGKTLMTAGKPQTERIVSRQFSLKYERKGRVSEIGTLYVVATLEGVYQRLRGKVLVILSIQACTIFLLSVSILVIFQSLVTRHLTAMARYARELDLHKLDSHLALARRASKSSQSDELEQVVTAINDMQGRMRTDIAKRERAEEALKEYSERLEEMVEERTKELREAQEELIRKERLAVLGHFAGSISHELRNPLGVIDSSVYYLKMKLGDSLDEKVRQHLERIKSSVKSAIAIVQSLLNLTRMKKPDAKKHDLIVIVAESLRSSNIPDTIAVTRHFFDNEIPVNVEREQIRMALKNIIKNGIEAMEGAGMLSVTIRKTETGQAELIVQDTGAGIMPEHLEKVFQPLFSTRIQGIGFGLSITNMVIENHGGTIEAESEPGKGAAFTITLPIVEEGGQENGKEAEDFGG